MNNRGFTLISIVVILVMIGASAGVALYFGTQLASVQRERLVRDELLVFKEAITGNPRLTVKDGRADFGYVGSMGSLPSRLEDLYVKGRQPAFVFDNSLKVGSGWAGPYISPLIMEHLPNLKQDAFGKDYEYTTRAYTRSDGQVVSARIRSLGPDYAPDTGDDRVVEILRREIVSTVIGYVKDKGGRALQNVEVTLNLPQQGVLYQRVAITDPTGLFQFADVPFGIRSIYLYPKLSYVDGSGTAIGTNKDTLRFKINNLGANDVSLTSLRAVYPVVAFYEGVYVGGRKVFDYRDAGLRGSSGDVLTFVPTTIKGSGQPTGPVMLRVETERLEVPIVIQGRGGTLDIRYSDFRDTRRGPGGPVSIRGFMFTITSSDGSQFTFVAS